MALRWQEPPRLDRSAHYEIAATKQPPLSGVELAKVLRLHSITSLTIQSHLAGLVSNELTLLRATEPRRSAAYLGSPRCKIV